MYAIVVCKNCNKPSVSLMSQKSRRCPYCGRRIDLFGSRIVAKAASAEDARMILSKEKERLYRSRKGKSNP